MYYYGARYYDPRISIFVSVDPLAEKYPSVSSYVYCLNNPILFVDPDGRDIVFAETVRKDGTRVITMTVTGKVINDSSKSISAEMMKSYAERMSGGIKKSFESASGEKFEVNVITNITVASSDSDLTSTDTAFRITDFDKIPDGEGGYNTDSNLGGRGFFGENVMYINEGILNNQPATDGFFKDRAANNGAAILERISSHELGHNGNLDHPDDPNSNPGNLMHQSKNFKNMGNKVTKEQLLQMKNDFDNGKLNGGIQKVD